MTAATIQKASLWRESLSAIKSSAPTMWPLLLILGVLISFCNFSMAQPSAVELQLQANPQLLQQHPEMMKQIMGESAAKFFWMLFPLLLNAVGYYILTVKYLQLAMKRNRPELSVSGFFYWFGKVFLKWLRAFWILVPIVGWFFFYPRAILRYELVSPLAVLRRGDELKTSWTLTEGNWWRICGNELLLAILVMGLPLLVFVGISLGYMVTAVAAHQLPAVQQSMGVRIICCLLYGIIGSLGVLVGSIYPCICYRVLSQESQQKPVSSQAQATPSSQSK